MSQKLLAVSLAAALLLAACGTSTQPAAPPPVAANVQGQELFALNCGECHSDDGAGTDEAPAVRGHTVEDVLKQVREPEGDMEAILPDKLSDADLQLIAEYVSTLPGEEAHPDTLREPTDEEAVHLKAAFESIEDYENMNREAAITHLDQAVALASGDAAELYEELIKAIEAKKAGNARHELKELLGLEEEH